jgi:3-deoxy-D-manno-octulosonic acid hydroxylase-like protein
MAEVLEFDRRAGSNAPLMRDEALAALERGAVAYLPHEAFEMREEERRFLDPAIVAQPRKHAGRARIIYLPASRRLLKSTLQGQDRQDLEAMMKRFSDWARDLIVELFPTYMPGLEQGPASFRPCPRTGPQRLHVDSFFLFPTEGRRVLRVLTNIDPDGRPRVWQFGDEGFEPFAQRLLPRVRREIPASGWLLERLGITIGKRTPYDHMMRQLRNMTKVDDEYQRDTPRRVMEFPTGSSWIVFTDQVLHGALAGQYAFEQTFLLDIDVMQEPARSPLRILENLAGRRLA